MDDILASIRKIIAEEPAAIRPPPEPRANPRPMAGAPAASDLAQPAPAASDLAAGLSSAVRAPAATPAHPSAPDTLSRALHGLSTAPAAAPLAAKPGASAIGAVTAFDDLDDLLEEAPASPLRPSPGQHAAAPIAIARLPADTAMPVATPAPAPQPAKAPLFGSLGALPARPQADTPRSFDELLRARPAAPSAPPAKSDLDAAQPPSALGDLGSVVPTRSGFGAPSAETPRAELPRAGLAQAAQTQPTQPAQSPDPFQWSGPKFIHKAAAPASEAPPFGASVLKAPQTSAQQPAAAAAASDPETAEASRYEVIAAMPSPVAKTKDAPMPGLAGASPAAASAITAEPRAVRQEPARPAPFVSSLIAPLIAPAPSTSVSGAPVSIGDAPTALDHALPAVPVAIELPQLPELSIRAEQLVPAEPSPPLADGDIAESAEAGFEAAAIESTAAAASALGALAAGLAASSKSMLPRRVDAVDTPPEASPSPSPAAETAPTPEPVAAEPPVVVPAMQSVAPEPTAAVAGIAVIPSSAATQPMTLAPSPAPVTVAPVQVTPPDPASGPAPVPALDPSAAATQAAAAPEPAPMATAAPAPAHVRSLDDTVADLLRPMLRQWLADNMPRIVEKALRIEVAESMRTVVPQPKSD